MSNATTPLVTAAAMLDPLSVNSCCPFFAVTWLLLSSL